MKRAVFKKVVRIRRNTARISIASPCDFSSQRREFIDDGKTLFLPYCFDFIARRAIYVSGASSVSAQAAPFYYLHLRQKAAEILSVPIEHGPLTEHAAESHPVFLFSPGRVGSTLVSRVLAEAGIASVSEPDFYTQLAALPAELTPWRSVFERAMWAMTDDLSAALGAAPVIKLRAECARHPELFLRRPGVRTIVLFRGFESWSRSTAKVFGAGPEKAVRKYLAALQCYERLSQSGQCHLMRYEDWLNNPAATAAALSAFLGQGIAPEAVERALQSHSQEGTPLRTRSRPQWEAKWQAALALWQSPRLVTARSRLEIPPVWD